MVGIEDVAREVGMSASTVSRALRDLPLVSQQTKQVVRAAADRLGYVRSAAASGLVTGRAMAISVVVPAVGLWFYSQVIEGVDTVLRQADYDMALVNLGGVGVERERAFKRSLLRHRGDAVLALCVDFSHEEREELRQLGLPVIVVGTPVRGLRFVGIDEVAAGYQATQHLIDLGHRDILHLTGGAEEQQGLSSRVPQGRLTGYEQALRDAGIPPDPGRVLEGRFSMSASRDVVDDLVESGSPLPTAIFAASDEMAFGAMLSLNHHGLSVPDDISVIGIDNHVMADPFGLTTLAQRPFDQGVEGARILLDELAGRPPRKTSLVLPVHLIDRGSTAPVRA
ncbi:MAG: LacI family transcriptional regulator [Propionibacteriaceae bacterium]|nr:LacI family transcriptional regulator [Propionibacteriaceae bacterium]